MDIASAQPIVSAPPDIRTGVYRGHVVTYEVIDGLAVWDGDIILGTPEELDPCGECTAPGKALDSRTKALAAVSNSDELWPGGIIPYVIDPELINPHVLDAIQHWNENTVIRLVERTDQSNWVRFVPGRGCRAGWWTSSNTSGRQGAGIALSKTCGFGGVVHEIGHIVGLWHEHQRNDRDSHVWVRPNPFDPNRINFQKKGKLGLDIGPYDYGSIMHYGRIPYIRTIPPSIALGSGVLSAGDIDGVDYATDFL